MMWCVKRDHCMRCLPPQFLDDDSTVPRNCKLQERLDFQLREGMVENQYINSIFAHTGYWNNADVALFMMCQIYTYKRD